MEKRPHRSQKQSMNLETMNFQIDPSHHGLAVSSLPFSTRARNILTDCQVKLIGDLHNTPLARVRGARNSGSKSFVEILRVLAPYWQRGAEIKASRKKVSEASFHVPESARDWPLRQLPISARLEHILTRLKIEKLGDLSRISPSTLAATPDCGMRTTIEAREFLGRIQRGEFGNPRQSTGMSLPLFLVTRIDEFMDSLSEPRREIFCRRLGAADAPWTLMRIGQKFNMTRERVRQIVNLLANEALRFGGPPMASALEEMTEEQLAKVVPYTPELLEARLGASAAKRRYGLAFYLRALEMLAPRAPIWPKGAEPAPHRARESEAILQTLAHWMRVHPEPTVFATLLAGIREESGFACTPAALLRALRYAVGFAFDFSEPEKPTLMGGRRVLRRWASPQGNSAEQEPSK